MTKQILPLTFLTYTLGCRTNQEEIFELEDQLIASGCQPVKNNPKLILINTCAVTLKAERESRKAIRHFKRQNNKAKIVALGCAAKFLKEADLIIPNQKKNLALKIIKKKFPDIFPDLSPGNTKKDKKTNILASSGRALVKIQEGCNQFCSYCLVPFLRGKPVSIPSGVVICKVNQLVDEGIKEIILCGINLSLYGQDFNPSITLADLIKEILRKTEIERITLSSIEPEFLYQDKELVDIFQNEPRLAKYFHLALQSGSKTVLKDMGRKTDLSKLLEAIKRIKIKIPEFTFRADVIIGFPTETEVNFQETLNFIKKAPVCFCHVFTFSLRPGTLAETMVKKGVWRDLPPATKKKRAEEIALLTQAIQKKEQAKLKGKKIPCLMIKQSANFYEAIAHNSWPVKVKILNRKFKEKEIKGKIFPIRIIHKQNGFLAGEI